MKLSIALSALIASALSLGSAPAQSADYPDRPIILVVPFAAGSTSDGSARIAAQQMSKTLGQSVTVENRVGAGGTIATTYVARSAPDGYTLLWAPSSVLGIAPHVMPKLPWDPVTSFTTIGLVARIPMMIATTNTLPVKSFNDLVELARARPGQVRFQLLWPMLAQNCALKKATLL